MATFDIAEATELTKPAIVAALKKADEMKVVTASIDVDLDSLQTRVTVLEDEIYEVEIFEYITSGTSGSVTIPTGATIRLDQYEGLADCLLAETEDSKPTETPPTDSEGDTVLCTLDADGNYIFTGTPESYPVAIIYQVAIKGLDIGNISLDVMLSWGELYTAANVSYDNSDSGLSATNVKGAIDNLSSAIDTIKTLTWYDILNSWTTIPTEVEYSGDDGTVYIYVCNSISYYRFVPDDYTPSEDIFYSSYINPDFSGYIASRG